MKASRFLIAGAVAALLPLAAAVAQTPPPAPTEQPATTPPPAEPSQPAADTGKGVTFESLDTDSDGRVSKTEAAVNPNVSDQFTRYDKNGNGYIERDEVTSSNSAPSDNPSKQ